jgi:hypothetical protein
MIWVDWHLGQFINLTEIIQGSDLKFTIPMHYYPIYDRYSTTIGKRDETLILAFSTSTGLEHYRFESSDLFLTFS